MLRAALRDLQWRHKRFLITIIGTALVFTMSLMMSGLSNSFSVEVDRTLDDQEADWWITRDDAAGAFSPGSFLTSADVAALTDEGTGFSAAAPVFYGTSTVETAPGVDGNEVITVTVFGVVPDGIGAPRDVVDGTTSFGIGEVVVPRSLGKDVGDELRISGAAMLVAGVVDKASLLGGTPTVTMTLEDAQRLLVGGQPLSSMVVAAGTGDLPGPYRAFDRDEARHDLLRPLQNPISSIDFVKVLLWIVAGLIIASVVYLNVLERTRDIAVFKATGVSSGAIGAGICLQAVIVSVLASIVGIGLAFVLVPMFPMDVVISGRSIMLLPVLAVVVGSLAGLVGVRRTATVAPATAFGGP